MYDRSPIFEGIMTLIDGTILRNAGIDPNPVVDASIEGIRTLMDGIELRIPDVEDDADA